MLSKLLGHAVVRAGTSTFHSAGKAAVTVTERRMSSRADPGANPSPAHALNVAELDLQGFTVVSDIFSAEDVVRMQADYSAVKSEAMAMISRPGRERVWTENNEETRSVFWREGDRTILQAGEGRYDLHKGFRFKGSFFDSPAITRNPTLNRLMEDVLGDGGTYATRTGFVLSQPDSKSQYWHRDTDTLQRHGTDGRFLVDVDDFYFTALIPVTVDVTTDNGPTEFMVGSHRTTSDSFSSLSTAQACAPVGSALLFNGKMNHRGLGNPGDVERPVIYCVFHKRWYSDWYRAGLGEEDEGDEGE